VTVKSGSCLITIDDFEELLLLREAPQRDRDFVGGIEAGIHDMISEVIGIETVIRTLIQVDANPAPGREALARFGDEHKPVRLRGSEQTSSPIRGRGSDGLDMVGVGHPAHRPNLYKADARDNLAHRHEVSRRIGQLRTSSGEPTDPTAGDKLVGPKA
jgi:hypothetical protein